jgi:hypothetical protein
MIDSVLGATRATLSIDDNEVGTLSPGPFAFNAPTTLGPGTHVLTATGIDGGNRSEMTSINVRVMSACNASAPCEVGYCLGGYCVPGADVDGGLGAECLGNEACITRACASSNGEQLCVAPCDGNACPDGFACIGDETRVCWPDRGDGGCEVGGESSLVILLGIGFAAIVLRRRAPDSEVGRAPRRFRPRG